MDEETDGILQNRPAARDVDATDRKILGVLVDDATVSYAELGDRVGLSPPAAHERVKRLRRSGAIRSTAAIIDPKAVKQAAARLRPYRHQGLGQDPGTDGDFRSSRRSRRSIRSPAHLHAAQGSHRGYTRA